VRESAHKNTLNQCRVLASSEGMKCIGTVKTSLLLLLLLQQPPRLPATGVGVLSCASVTQGGIVT